MLYAISPAIGFIHSGSIESFVFDISDFYKEAIIIPLAFKIHSLIGSDIHYICRNNFRKIIIEKKLMTQITEDILKLFSTSEEDNTYSINEIWNIDELLPGGTNYGGNDLL